MKRLLLCVLALLAGDAFAAFDPLNPCGLTIPPPPVFYSDLFTTGAGHDCVPYPGKGVLDKSSTAPVVRTNAAGVVAYWYCKQADGSWAFQIAAVTSAQAATPGYFSSLASDLATAMTAADPLAAFNAVSAARRTTPMNDPALAAAWCPVWPEVFASIPPSPPPPPPPGRHVAAPATFLLRSGVLTPLLSKATVGAACTCPTPAPVIGGKTYCTFTGAIAAAVVAECS